MNGIDAVTGEYLPGPPGFEQIAEGSSELILHPRERRNRLVHAERRVDKVYRLPSYGVRRSSTRIHGMGVSFSARMSMPTCVRP